MQLPYHKTVLNNGITILTRSVDSVRSVAVGLFIQAGSCDENPVNNGIAHFLEHMSFKGTTTRDAYDIVEDIESRGGHINAYTSREMTAYYARVLDSELNTALSVLCDIVRNSRYPDDELEREKSVVIEEIRDSLDTPQDIANDAFMEQMFPRHPFGYPIMGTVDTVTSFTSQTIRDFIAKNYTSYRISVVVAGAVHHAAVVKQIEELMGDYKTITNVREEYPFYDPEEKERIISRDFAQSPMPF